MTLALTAAQTRRRLRRFAAVARAMLLAQGEARAYTHVAWLGLFALVSLAFELGALGWLIIPSLALFIALALVVLFDAVYFIIPDRLVGALFAFGAITLLGAEPQEALAHGAAAVFGYGAFYLVAALYERLRGEAGLGLGDAKLFAAAGLWLGFDGLASCLLVAVASAALSGFLAWRAGALQSARQAIPFGPHLALGFWLAWAIGPLQPV